MGPPAGRPGHTRAAGPIMSGKILFQSLWIEQRQAAAFVTYKAFFNVVPEPPVDAFPRRADQIGKLALRKPQGDDHAPPRPRLAMRSGKLQETLDEARPDIEGRRIGHDVARLSQPEAQRFQEVERHLGVVDDEAPKAVPLKDEQLRGFLCDSVRRPGLPIEEREFTEGIGGTKQAEHYFFPVRGSPDDLDFPGLDDIEGRPLIALVEDGFTRLVAVRAHERTHAGEFRRTQPGEQGDLPQKLVSCQRLPRGTRPSACGTYEFLPRPSCSEGGRQFAAGGAQLIRAPNRGTFRRPDERCAHRLKAFRRGGRNVSTPSHAERKLATVLFADLVGHTEILTRIDPEEWQGLLRAYFGEVAERIQKYGGTVEKLIGDAVLAVFGVPRVHEDDAERAVRAALEIQDGLLRLAPMFRRRIGTSLGLRIAIATGEVVAPGTEQLVTGEVAALAERLQQRAPANTIILSERTYHLVASLVEVQPLGPLTLRGFSEQHRAFLVQRLRSPAEKGRGVGTGPTMVGRERELKALLAGRDRLLAGGGQILAIIGDAGLGKSRLIAELQDRIGSGIASVEAQCYEFTQATTYGVVVELLQQYLRLTKSDPADAGRVQLRAALYRVFESPPQDLLQALEHLLEVDTTREFEDNIRGLGPEEVRTRVVHAISAFWEAVAAKGPILLVIEDFHWIDSASAGALGELLQVIERVPLMLVLAFRPERRSLAWEFRVTAEREYPHQYREVRLEPLLVPDTEHLAGLLLENIGLSSALKEGVAQRAEGNPLFVEEIVQSLRQHGDSPTALIRLPDTLQGVLQARLDDLPPGTKRVLQTASVIGRTFALKLLSAVSGMNGDLTSHLSVLQRTEFLHEQLRQPERRFAFKHVLLQEAAYQTLLREERRELHRRIAEALEREPHGGTDLPVLVYHFVNGEYWEKAFTCAVRAADASRSLSALEAALEQYAVALGIARDHPGDVRDQTLVLHAQEARGDVLSFLGRNEEAERHFEELLARYRAPDVRARIHRSIGRMNSLAGNLQEAEANLKKALGLFEIAPDPAAEAETFRELAYVMERRRDFAKARESANRALAIAEKHSLRPQIRDVYQVLAVINFYGGDWQESARYAQEGLVLATQDNDTLGIVRSRNALAYFLLFAGNVREALAHIHEAMPLIKNLGIGTPLAAVQDTLALILLEQCKLKDASDVVDSLEQAVHRYSLGEVWEAVAHRLRGFLALAQEHYGEAVDKIQEARRLEQHLGVARNLPMIDRGLAEAYLGQRNFRRALAFASKVISHEQGGNPIETPAALRVQAVVARERGEPDRACQLLEHGLSLMERRTCCGEYARALLELAKTYVAAGESERAREAGQKAIDIFTVLDATPLAEVARQFVAQF